MKSIISKPFFLCFAVAFCWLNAVQGQSEQQPINLETALTLGGANNLTIKEFKLKQELAAAELTKSKEWWLPDLYAGVTSHQLNGNAMNGDGNFFVDVDRQSFWGGIGLNATWNFGDGIFLAKAAELRSEAAFHQTAAEKNHALLDIIESYYDFLAAQLYYAAYEKLATQADTIAQQMSLQVQIGLRLQSDELLAKSNYNHLRVEMLNARNDWNDAKAELTRLLNLDPYKKLIAVDNILVPLDLITGMAPPSIYDSSYQKRPEIKSQTLTLASLNQAKRTTTSGLWLPELQVGTYGSYFGGVFEPINPTSEVNAALMWKIPLGRLTYGGTLQKFNTQIGLQENEIAQTKAKINAEVMASSMQISTYKEQIEISLEGSQMAEEALNQTLQRQSLGMVRPLEILQAQEMFMKSRLDYLKAVASYNKAQYSYFVAIGNNL